MYDLLFFFFFHLNFRAASICLEWTSNNCWRQHQKTYLRTCVHSRNMIRSQGCKVSSCGTTKTQIRLCGCAEWFESSLGAHIWSTFSVVAVHLLKEIMCSTMCGQLSESCACANCVTHYENSPIQIYRKFHLQKLKMFRWKTLIFFTFLLKT